MMNINLNTVFAVTNPSEILNLYYKDMRKYRTISREEEVELAERIQQGDKKSLDKLVESNLGFAHSVARRFQGRGVDIMDLTQVANIALIMAAENYVPTKGAKFCSFAVYYILREIYKAINEYGGIVRSADSCHRNRTKLERIITDFVEKYGFMPTAEQLMEMSGLTAKAVKKALDINSSHVSLDAPMFDEESSDFCMSDFVRSDDRTDADVEEEYTFAAIKSLLSGFPIRDVEMVKMAWGEEYSYAKIGERFGLSGERVSQIVKGIKSYLRKKLCGPKYAIAC